MKTQVLHFEIYNTQKLVDATEKLVIDTATDIFSMSIYKKQWNGWKLIYSFDGFSGFALSLLRKLNYWLEEYGEGRPSEGVK